MCDIDEVIRIIREEDEPKQVMMARWKLSEIQANAILDMRLRALTAMERQRVLDELAELRALIDVENKWTANGVLLGWRWPQNSGDNLHLIDTTPSSAAGRSDAPLVVGQTFVDSEAEIYLTTLAVATDASGERSADVRVNFGPFPGNRAPTLALAASALNVPAGAQVTFTATATDPDADALAYHWRSSDNSAAATAVVGPNAPAFTRSFATAGQYVVTCTVSDMKGAVATRFLLVTVGNGNSRSAISGRITLAGQGLAGVGLSTGTGNGVVTDSDGYYTIPNLSAGTYTVSPLLFGYTFNELFNNSVLVGPNFSGANFSAELVPTVSIAATTPPHDGSHSTKSMRLNPSFQNDLQNTKSTSQAYQTMKPSDCR